MVLEACTMQIMLRVVSRMKSDTATTQNCTAIRYPTSSPKYPLQSFSICLRLMTINIVRMHLTM